MLTRLQDDGRTDDQLPAGDLGGDRPQVNGQDAEDSPLSASSGEDDEDYTGFEQEEGGGHCPECGSPHN